MIEALLVIYGEAGRFSWWKRTAGLNSRPALMSFTEGAMNGRERGAARKSSSQAGERVKKSPVSGRVGGAGCLDFARHERIFSWPAHNLHSSRAKSRDVREVSGKKGQCSPITRNQRFLLARDQGLILRSASSASIRVPKSWVQTTLHRASREVKSQNPPAWCCAIRDSRLSVWPV